MNGPAVLEMWWRDVLTVHWRADASLLAHLLPAGIELDLHDGDAWLSVVPFRMTDVRVRFAPVLAGFANVPELNLRTYVRAGAITGIFFFSLDADAPLVVRAARIMTGLPYLHARIAQFTDCAGIAFSSERTDRRADAGRFRARYRAEGEPFVPQAGSLEHFLHERYRFFVRRGGALHLGEVRHAPWRLQNATIEIAENTIGTLASHTLAEPPAYAFFTRALYVRASAVLPFRGQSPA